MVYEQHLTVPANTPIISPYRESLRLTGGLIYRVNIRIDSGHAGLTGLRVMLGTFQLWPYTRNVWFYGDGETIDFEDRHMLSKPDNVMTFEGYNNDEAFEHTFKVRVGLVSDPDQISYFLPGAVTRDLINVLAIAGSNTGGGILPDTGQFLDTLAGGS